jgi:hypothetical protein
VTPSIGQDAVDMDACLCLLWFLKEAPESAWPGHFGEHAGRIAEARAGRLLLIAPFVPTLPGTNQWVQEGVSA